MYAIRSYYEVDVAVVQRGENPRPRRVDDLDLQAGFLRDGLDDVDIVADDFLGRAFIGERTIRGARTDDEFLGLGKGGAAGNCGDGERKQELYRKFSYNFV